ncbi:MAG: hypothetical protein Q8M97_05820 [Methanobacteriaceae archaeon]|nr:hypothetical protein [Methanobacteriaceae archaeon]
MSSNSEFNFPENIKSSIEEEYKERRNKLSAKNQKAYAFFLDSQSVIEGDKEIFNEFLNSLIENDYKNNFVDIIENFEDIEVYRRFLASILIYMRINNFEDSPDKFLYFCIAVEAAMQFKSNKGKGNTRLFKDFFKENLSEDSKLKMISHFKIKEVNNTVKSQNFLMYKYGKSKLIKNKKKSFVPSCYRLKQCYVDTGKCYPKHGCYLKSNPHKINDQLDHVLDYLYQKRSNFVHDGRVFSHPVDGSIGDVWRHPAKKKFIGISYSLNLYDLFSLYEEALLTYFTKINGAE